MRIEIIFVGFVRYFVYRCKLMWVFPRKTQLDEEWQQLEDKLNKNRNWSKLIRLLPDICRGLLIA